MWKTPRACAGRVCLKVVPSRTSENANHLRFLYGIYCPCRISCAFTCPINYRVYSLLSCRVVIFLFVLCECVVKNCQSFFLSCGLPLHLSVRFFSNNLSVLQSSVSVRCVCVGSEFHVDTDRRMCDAIKGGIIPPSEFS